MKNRLIKGFYQRRFPDLFKKNKKITKYRRYSFFNIGTLLFGIVFLYMIICLFLYFTDTHITSYEVQRGSITGNYRFHALSLRTETIVNATQSGGVRYYVREGSRTSAGSTVCSINETGSTDPIAYNDFSMTSDDESRMQNMLSSFTMNFTDNAFQNVYELKSNVQTAISEILQDSTDAPAYVRNQCTASESGFVIYNIDGYESLTDSDINSAMFDRSSYHVQNLRNSSVSAGNPLFKLITKEDWALYFPIDDKLRTELADATTLRFRFLKDNVTFSAPFMIIQNGTESFGKITLSNSLVRYATDRFLEIELVMNKKTGLKIPTSAIVQREFYRIPEDYVTKNEDTDTEITLKVEHFDDDGSSTTRYVTANVYSHSDGYYLVDRNLLTEGDSILMENSSNRIQLQEKDVEVLHGVYNINKGYAVFREITVIDENEEYCIVSSNNIYSLAAYDYIVMNADEVTEDQIVY